MRILHVIQRYHPAIGGAELHMQEISAWLSAAGHDVTVVTSDALDFELFWEPARRRVGERSGVHRGVRVRRFPLRHLPVSRLAYAGIRRLLWFLSKVPPVPERFMLHLANYTPWASELWRWADSQTEPYDLVGATTTAFEPFVHAGLKVARRQGVPFVCYPLTHLGAGPKPGDDPNSRFYIMRHQVGLVAASDAVMAQTGAERDYYIGRGVAAEKIFVLGSGVTPEAVLGGDGQRFRRRYDIRGPLVLAVGAMDANKGTVQTVEAVRQLWRAGRQVELVLIGAILSPFAAYLKGLPADDRERIHVLGPVDEDTKRDAFAAATIFSMPSRTESFGITYLEAWLYGLPVIGARSWGVMDVIQDGRDGLLVPYDESPVTSGVPALTEAMAYLLDHPDDAARMGQAGREKVYAEHTWEIKCRMVQDVYEQLVAAR